jgi:1-phosphatidylinositol-4-phosphate 5-kinase
MWCCGSDVLKQDGKYRKSVFDKKEIEALKRKFNNVSGDQKFITRETFKKNIGYLGIRAVTSFLDRIFNSFDIDGDNKVKPKFYV